MPENRISRVKPRLRFRPDGGFRVLMVSDVHAGRGYDKEHTVAALRALILAHKPDLVLFAGDTAGPGTIHVETEADLRDVLDSLTAPLTEMNLPWAHVFGNHDNNYGLSNADQEKIYETYPLCLSEAGPEDVSGVGNYVLPVFDSDGLDLLFNIFGLDSHRGMNEMCGQFGIDGGENQFFHPENGCRGGYDTVHFDQVMWYYQTSLEAERRAGRKIPALMYLHIPLPEHALAALHREDTAFSGHMGEDVACSALNSGLFCACLERGDVKAIFCGHDHENDFSALYGGIALGYDGFLSYHASNNADIRGGRIFDLRADDPWSIKTYMVRVRDALNRPKGDV